MGWEAEGAESRHTMLVTAHGSAREAPGASGPQAALRASNATGVLAAGPLKTCRTFLGPSSSALSSTLQSRPWEVQGAAPSVLCALPSQLHVPFFQSHLQKGPWASTRVSSQQTQGGAKIPAVPWFAGDMALLLPGCRGWGEGEGKTDGRESRNQK